MHQETSPRSIALFLLEIVDRVTRRFMRPRLDLVFGGDLPPYLHTYPIMDGATGKLVRGRWYRVGVLNRSRVPVSDVRVQLWKAEPVPFPIQPVTLHFKDDNPGPGTPARLSIDVPAGPREPTVFVDLLAQREKLPFFQVLHTVPNVPHGSMLARQSTLTLRVTGHDARGRMRRFTAGLNESNELTMAAADKLSWWRRGLPTRRP